MREIHLGRILAEQRRSRGITQDELAEFLGRSEEHTSELQSR